MCMCAFTKIQAYMIFIRLCGWLHIIFCIKRFFFFLGSVRTDVWPMSLEYLFHHHVLIDESDVFVCDDRGDLYQSMCRSNIHRSRSFHSSSLFKHDGSIVLFVFLLHKVTRKKNIFSMEFSEMFYFMHAQYIRTICVLIYIFVAFGHYWRFICRYWLIVSTCISLIKIGVNCCVDVTI